MKIVSINIKNFKGLEDVQKEINGQNVYLIGKNGSGKTSFIDAVWGGLTGKNLPEEPTHNGNKKGLIEIDLGDCIARTKFTKGRPTKFELERKEYEKEADKLIKSPRTYLEDRIGLLNFDIEQFFAKSNLEQVRYFSKIMSVDFSDLDADLEELAESRKFDKRKLAEFEAKNTWYKKEDIERPFINVVDLSKKISDSKDKKETYDKIAAGINEREAKIEALRAEIVTLEGQVKDGQQWLNSDENKPLADEAIAKLQEELENSDELNNAKREAHEAQEAEQEVENYRKMIEEQTEEIEKKRAEKAARISKNINVKGLTYDVNEERFLYEGLPFDGKQINTAAQLIAGMKIASTMLKDLKILRVDGSLIDKDNFDDVLAWSQENDIELFVELVDREGGDLQIVVNED